MFDVDKFYLMRKEFNIKLKEYKEIRRKLQKLNPNMTFDQINDFMSKAFNPKTRYEAFKENPKLGRQFREHSVKVIFPENDRKANNNKAINMSLAVLTHETTAAKILNPGGFEPQKRMGYLVSAYKMGSGKGEDSWEALSKLSTKALKNKCMTKKNLCYIDVNTQFYAQNNAAGSILGMFAVQKIAHAVLENNHLALDISTVLKLKEDEEFLFAGHRFHGYTKFDETFNSKGEYIGKVLGSLVASAADAVKDPVLNLMNINSTTANVLTTMIRLGIPFETASMLLSQQVITDALSEFNISSIKGEFKSLNDIINTKIKDLKEKLTTQKGDQLSREELTEEELIKGLKINTSTEAIQYKALITFQKFSAIASELKGPTYVTRFNSISNAVGPHVIHNIIMKNKLGNFSPHIYVEKNGSYTNIDVNYIFNQHPILKSFRRALVIADTIFKEDIPIMSKSFTTCLDSLDEDVFNKMMGDTKLLSKYVDSYLSYCMLVSGCIKQEGNKGLKYYITEYPKLFINSDIKKNLSNNAFVKAIHLDFEKASNRYILKIDTTGLQETDKEKLSSGWYDLYQSHPDVAMDLFRYCFYRGGIGFNPKTFMHLLPVEMKEKINKYIDTFRVFQPVDDVLFNDQFIRNNWNNNKVVSKVDDIDWTKTKTITDKESKKEVIVISDEDAEKLKNLRYFKCRKADKKDHLYYIYYHDDTNNTVSVIEINPLGNNGEFFEMSLDDIKTSLQTPDVAKSSDGDPSIPEASDSEVNDALLIEIGMTKKEKAAYLKEIYDKLGKPKVTEFSNKTLDEKLLLKEKLNEWFKKQGIVSNDEEFEKVFKMFCGV